MMSIIGRVFSAMATRPSCLHLILLWIFSSTILCGCADHRVDVSHGPHGFKESAPLCFRPEIPFRYDVFVAHRRVWSGMRGGYMSSKAMGKSYLGHKHYFHSGGAHDVAMFLWLQMCMSGFPPHPGPDSEITKVLLLRHRLATMLCGMTYNIGCYRFLTYVDNLGVLLTAS